MLCCTQQSMFTVLFYKQHHFRAHKKSYCCLQHHYSSSTFQKFDRKQGFLQPQRVYKIINLSLQNKLTSIQDPGVVSSLAQTNER